MENLISKLKIIWQNWNIVILFAFFKLIIHLLTNTNYGFHRDEYLHLILGEHLAWGYMEVPPIIAVFGKLSLLLGGDLFIVRLLPTLIGSVTVILIGVMVRDLGGRKWAQIIACLAFIISPAFLRSNMLFQPVSFNQFCWFLSAFFIVRLVRYNSPKYWYYLGIFAGIGFLTKYSIVFFFTAFFIVIFFTPQRSWLNTKYPYLAAGIALLIALPNLAWQYQHNMPVIQHMTELSQTQLKNVNTFGFLQAQLGMHHAASIIWLSGLLFLFLSKKLFDYRILGLIYLCILILLVLLSGKSYYTLGAYPMLMVAGGVAIENFFKNKSVWLKYAFVFILCISTVPIIPYGLPVLPIDKMQQYAGYLSANYSVDGPLYWEDGKMYKLPQDYADMHGWEEMAAKTAKIYFSLPSADQKSCLLLGGSYSHASSISYYAQKYNLPEIYSFVGSHLIWIPDSVEFDRMIMIDDVFHTHLPQFGNIMLVDSIQNPYAREPGYIYYLTNPKIDIEKAWADLVRERKKAFNF